MIFGKENIKYSMRNLRSQKGRSFLTVFSILIGIATIFIFISFGLGIYNYVDTTMTASSADKILIQSKAGMVPGTETVFPLTDDDIRAIEKTQGVLEVSGVYMKSIYVDQDKEKRYTYLISIDTEHPLVMEMSGIGIEKGRMLQGGDSGKVGLGYNYLTPNKIFPKAYEINDKIEVQGKEMRIIGFVEEVGNPQDDSQIYVTNEYFKEAFPENLSYGMIIARVDRNNIQNTVDNVEKSLRKSRNVEEDKEDFTVQSFEDMLDSYMSAIDIIVGFILLIALISVLVSAVNTANTMITSVLERYKEIGVLKAIGARNSEILKIFLFESAFLGFVAGVAGVLLGWLLAYTGGVILETLGWGFLSPLFSWELFAGCIAFATITGAVSGVAPAIRASKIVTVDALRYE